MFFAAMCFLGVTSMDSLRVNPSVAITAMAVTNHKQGNLSHDQNYSTHACINVASMEDKNDTDVKVIISI